MTTNSWKTYNPFNCTEQTDSNRWLLLFAHFLLTLWTNDLNKSIYDAVDCQMEEEGETNKE